MDISDLIHVGDLAGWTSQKNLPVRFTIKTRNGSLDGVLAAQSIDVREGINVGINGHVTCVSQRSDLPFEAFKGVVGVIEIVTAQGRLRRIPALIKQAIRGQDDGSLSLYQFHVIDPLTLLRERITTRVFRRASVPMITDIVLNELRRNIPPLGYAFSVVMELDSSRYPEYEFTLQHQESVADFLIRLWKRHGINFYFRPAENEVGPPMELVLFDNSYLLPINPFAGALRYHRLDGTEQEDSIVQWAEGSRLVGSRGQHFSHDYKAHHVNEAVSGILTDQGEDGNALAALLEDMRIDVPHAGDNREDFMRQTQLRMSRHDFECNFVHGISGSRDMAVGQYHEINGHGLLDLRKREERQFVVTSIHHRAENNRKDIGARVAKLIKRSEHIPGWACMEPIGDDQDPDARHKYMNAFTAVRRAVGIVPYFDARTDVPVMPRMRVEIVATEISPVHTDELARVKVRFLGLRPEDHVNRAGTSGYHNDSAWIQVDLPWAGNGMGFLFPPRAGMLGVVDFEMGDPSKPVLVACHYSGRNRPPRLNSTDGIPKTTWQSGIQSQEIRGFRYNRLVFDDTPGEISVQLASQYAYSQLNLGWNTHPRTQEQGKPRRTGFELRTDEWGAVRAGNGLLITTESRPEAQAHITDMAETVDRLAQAQQQHQNLSNAAHQAQAQQSGDQDEVAKVLQSQVKEVKGRPAADGTPGEFEAPHLTLASPAGLETSTQGTTHVVSTEHNALTSGGHTSISAGKSLLASAKEAIRLFAYNAGMKLVAASADIDITALRNSINLLAKLDITLTANKISIKAEQEVEIVGGTSFSRWNGSGIEHGSNGRWLQQAASHSVVGLANAPGPQIKPLDVALKETPPQNQLAAAMLPVPGAAMALMAGQPYALLKNGAQVEQGRFDEYGRLKIEKAEKGATYQVKLPNGTVHDVPVAQEKMAYDPADASSLEHQLSNKGYRADGQAADARLTQRERGASTASSSDSSPDTNTNSSNPA